MLACFLVVLVLGSVALSAVAMSNDLPFGALQRHSLPIVLLSWLVGVGAFHLLIAGAFGAPAWVVCWWGGIGFEAVLLGSLVVDPADRPSAGPWLLAVIAVSIPAAPASVVWHWIT